MPWSKQGFSCNNITNRKRDAMLVAWKPTGRENPWSALPVCRSKSGHAENSGGPSPKARHGVSFVSLRFCCALSVCCKAYPSKWINMAVSLGFPETNQRVLPYNRRQESHIFRLLLFSIAFGFVQFIQRAPRLGQFD